MAVKGKMLKPRQVEDFEQFAIVGLKSSRPRAVS